MSTVLTYIIPKNIRGPEGQPDGQWRRVLIVNGSFACVGQGVPEKLPSHGEAEQKLKDCCSLTCVERLIAPFMEGPIAVGIDYATGPDENVVDVKCLKCGIPMRFCSCPL